MSNDIIKAFSYDSNYEKKLILINVNDFKNNKQLKNAVIFNRLFNINKKHDNWAKKSMEKDENGNITLLQDLNISQDDWNLFMAYIKHGIPPYFYTKSYTLFSQESIIKKVEKLNEICNKLGGIPTFDVFYEKFVNSEINKKNIFYNPQSPEEDSMQKYNWTICYSSNPSDVRINTNNGWSCCKVVNEPNTIGYSWWRKLKKKT